MIKTKRDLKRLESELNHIQDSLNRYSEDFFNQKINDLWKRLKTSAGDESLKTMPIDTMSVLEKGLPINTLVNHNLRFIYDLKDKRVFELKEIDGIGEKGAHAIVHAVSKISESVYEQAKPRINPDHLSEDDLELLASIYKKRKILKLAELLKGDFKALNEAISPDLETAKTQRSFIGSLFQSKTVKEAIKLAVDRLNDVQHKDNLKNMKEELHFITHFKVDQEELIQHFIQENASYYTEVEKVTGFDQTTMADDLPGDIVATVNEISLDMTDLDVELRHYQEFGAKYILHYKRTLLGDEMGLGKTVQALAMINHLFQNNQKYSIVVCPLSVLANWKREVHKFSNLHTFIFHGKNRDEEFQKWQAQAGVLITTYEQTSRMNFEEGHRLDALIVDEAHYVKNPEAKRSQSVYELTEIAEYVLFMSGTPLENRLEEMQQLLSVLQPNIAEQLSEELHLLQPSEFKQIVAPVYLRRNRKDVLAELPELEVIPQWMDFGEEEKRQYHQAVIAGKLMSMRRAAWLGGSPEKSPKLEKLLDICNEAYENGQKVLVFSFFRDVLDTVQHHLQGRTFEAITGDVPNARRQDIIDEFTKAPSGSVLISQITAGGVGLNIQAANVVVLCEPQWKPSTEEQAISRAYRMGQSRNVIVYRLLTEESIDVAMLEVLGEKSNLFDLYARESEVASRALNEHEEGFMKQRVLEIEKERLVQHVG